MPQKFHLVLLIHAHQPVGNFDDVLERAYKECYRPFLERLHEHPGVRIGLHYSGVLLEWLERRHPEYFVRLRELVGRGQAELVGGGFYEPILIVIPPADQQAQLQRMAVYLERHFGRRPAGAWLAERVWEPQLPSALGRAGVAYTLTDDIHFLSAGFERDQLFGSYTTEDAGLTVRVLPGLKALRYLLPFRPVEEAIAFLREAASAHPGGMAAMGDDMEKFGVWPGTWKHCYEDGWLEKFFQAVETNSDWLEVTPPGEYLGEHASLGRADLPTASYSEMMEWVLPTRVRQRFHAVQQEFSSRPEVLAFLRGGSWRGFFTKYAEANLLHKKMLRVSAKLAELRAQKLAPKAAGAVGQATEHLLRAQCNDAYWHGIFGGLYAPHLRTSLWRDLVRAETIADGLARASGKPQVERVDFDADGAEEAVISAAPFWALFKPTDGATLAALDFRPASATLVNSIMRRPEAYHTRLREAASSSTEVVASIHEQVRVKEPGLERHLLYDRWPRHAFRLLLFAPEKTHADYEALRLDEDAGFAGGVYETTKAAGADTEFFRTGELSALAPEWRTRLQVRALKKFRFAPLARGFEVSCDVTLSHRGGAPLPLAVGLESVVNLLAPNEPDRYIETSAGRRPLRWSGAVPASTLSLTDGWQKLRVMLEAPEAREFWLAPIETVSESEAGFERVYQGSQILAVWLAEVPAEKPWSAHLVWRIESL